MNQELPEINLEDAPLRERSRGFGPLRRPRLWMAIAAGCLLSLAFPFPGIAGIAWIAPTLLLASGLGADDDRRFGHGWWAGFLFFLFSLDWLLFMPFPAGAVAGWLALSAYCAVYFGIWTWGAWVAFPGRRPLRDRVLTFDESPRSFCAAAMETSWIGRQFWAIYCAALWVGLEFVRGWALTGFPWNFVGVSQARMPVLTQIASIGGVYLVSFVVIHFSVTLLFAGISITQNPKKPWGWIRETLVAIALIGTTLGFGLNQLRDTPATEASVRIALVQPSVPQTLVWDDDPEIEQARVDRVTNLTRIALGSDPDIVLWPEESIPMPTRESFGEIVDLMRSHKVWALLGLQSFEGDTQEELVVYNSVWKITPNGVYEPFYNKRRLVVFGEKIPLEDVFPFMKNLTPITSSFGAGKSPGYIEMTDLGLEASVFICFEDALPDLALQSVRDTTDLLINFTNDGWFSESSNQWQHAYNAAFRAIESGRPLIRCTNNGLSLWIDARGQLHNVEFEDERKSVYDPGVKVFELPKTEPESTFYLEAGHQFPLYALAFSGVILIASLIIKPSRKFEDVE